MAKMNPEVKAKWVAALRSGEYKQSRERVLADGRGGFCCLGVLCDLYAKATGSQWEPDVGGLALPNGGLYYPPEFVREWASFHEDQQLVSIGSHEESVAVHNDGIHVPRASFAKIADAIEEQL